MSTHVQDCVALLALRFAQDAWVMREHARQDEQGNGNKDGHLSGMGRHKITFEVTKLDGMIITAYNSPKGPSVFTNERHKGRQVREGSSWSHCLH